MRGEEGAILPRFLRTVAQTHLEVADLPIAPNTATSAPRDLPWCRRASCACRIGRRAIGREKRIGVHSVPDSSVNLKMAGIRFVARLCSIDVERAKTLADPPVADQCHPKDARFDSNSSKSQKPHENSARNLRWAGSNL
jgi:hypothetical protein